MALQLKDLPNHKEELQVKNARQLGKQKELLRLQGQKEKEGKLDGIVEK